MKLGALTRLERNAHRVGEILAVFAKYGLADWFKGWHVSWIQDRIQTFDGQHIPNLKFEERVRLAFMELGTTFIKLGQVLSTRPDLVGPDLALELAHLQTAAPADPPDTVRATMEAELGRTPETLFAAFDYAPLASASIAQVHLARLHTGEEVVVKIQRAGLLTRSCRTSTSWRGWPSWRRSMLSRFGPISPARWSASSGARCCANWISPSSAATSRSSRLTSPRTPRCTSRSPTRSSARAEC